MCMIGEWQRAMNVPKSQALTAFRKFEFDDDDSLIGVFWQDYKYKRGTNRPLRNDWGLIQKPLGETGLWSYTSAKDAVKVGNQVDWIRYGFGICGRVKIWGRMSVHRYGYRSMYLEIVRLVVDKRSVTTDELRILEKSYGVPVAVVSTQKACVEALRQRKPLTFTQPVCNITQRG